MTGWYDISSSAISKAIRAIAKSPLELITIEEHPKSAREKLITLTPRGQKFVHAMVKNGTSMCRWFLDNMSKYEAERDIYLLISHLRSQQMTERDRSSLRDKDGYGCEQRCWRRMDIKSEQQGHDVKPCSKAMCALRETS